jgi:phosphoribosylformimino-5-aminoimidazole carboxamide ribotide isomerase
MELIPAVDLLGGRVVRLAQGDFDRATVYGNDPVEVARRWAGEGATRLHLVDLDGARAGRPVQADLIGKILGAVDIPCQVAGGLRSEDDVRVALEAGADRVVLASALLRSPDLARILVDEYGNNAVVAAIDVREGRAVGEGWSQAGRTVDSLAVIRMLIAAGIRWLAVTAIERDGLLGGPDLELLDTVAAAAPGAHLIASAGVATIADIRALNARGFAGAILGRALYERTIDLRAALAVVAPPA